MPQRHSLGVIARPATAKLGVPSDGCPSVKQIKAIVDVAHHPRLKLRGSGDSGDSEKPIKAEVSVCRPAQRADPKQQATIFQYRD
jgi:hypothetical protein